MINPNLKMAKGMRTRYHEDKRAGHKDAAEYWRGQAAAYFTANPRDKYIQRAPMFIGPRCPKCGGIWWVKGKETLPKTIHCFSCGYDYEPRKECQEDIQKLKEERLEFYGKNPRGKLATYFARNPLGPDEKYWKVLFSNGTMGIIKGKTRIGVLDSIRTDYVGNSGITITSIRLATQFDIKEFKAMGGHVANPLAGVLATVGNATLAGVGLGVGFGVVNYAKDRIIKKKNPTLREKRIDKYIRLERQLDTANNRRGRTIEKELGRLEIIFGITTDEVKKRREELKKNPVNNPIVGDIIKGLTPAQKKAFLSLLKSDKPQSAYELGVIRMDTMYILERKRLVSRVPGDRLGTIFSPTVSIEWKSRFRIKKK